MTIYKKEWSYKIKIFPFFAKKMTQLHPKFYVLKPRVH